MIVVSNTGYASYQLYHALHLHFTSNYDFIKYHGKTNVSPESFDRRRDKYTFARLSRKYSLDDLKGFFIANMVEKPDRWPGEFLQQDCEDIHKRWLKTIQSLSYVFQEELSTIFAYLTEEERVEHFRVINGEYPELLLYYMHKTISLETLVILNSLVGFINSWNTKITDTYIWPDIKRKCEKYAPFFVFDRAKMLEIFKEKLHESY